MADVPNEPKISVDSNETVFELHKKLKDTIDGKLKEKDWTEDKKEEFRGKILKLYKETAELALEENLVVKHEDKSNTDVKQEMEPVDKEKALEVNKMCAKSEDLLINTIRKRKHYPQKIKECLQKRHDADLNNLCNTDKRNLVENRVQADNLGESSALNEEQPDMTECEAYLTRCKKDSENLVLLSKPLAEIKDKAERLQAATETHLRMQDNDVYKALVGKRKIPSTFDSILVTPSKENANNSLTEPQITVASQFVEQTAPLKKLRCLRSKNSSNQT